MQDHEDANNQLFRFGFLFADLFAVLAILFLIANVGLGNGSGSTVPTVTPTTTQPVTETGTPTTRGCGLVSQPLSAMLLTAPDAGGMRSGAATAEASFAAQVKSRFAPFAQARAGLVQVYGGSLNGAADAAAGISLANGAVNALQMLAQSGFLFTRHQTLYQTFWDEALHGDQVRIVVFFYQDGCQIGA